MDEGGRNVWYGVKVQMFQVVYGFEGLPEHSDASRFDH